MGAPKVSSVQRGAAFAAVVAVHAGAVTLLIVGLRTPAPHSAEEFVSALILLTSQPRAVLPRPQRAPRRSVKPITHSPARPQAAPLPPTNSPVAPIDWYGEAQSAAGAVTSKSAVREFGRNPASEAERPRSGVAPQHKKGEQYRLETGEWIVWVSPHCYLTSGIPPIGLPDMVARAIPPRTICPDHSEPPGELFRDLSAFQKLHPQSHRPAEAESGSADSRGPAGH